ncbi:hypothetical protein [Pseudomonas sp. Gutcm_11s]|uniref:hypothetical protein n=1 Tax=Pseudomonas sp. Gutcm_11s TaxID=3026088 RepID=UPI002360CCE1|nr:hypothetical protein [Pseudomonas sp. Gutcm_11s]MDD0841253.1 hypothetical protein [Pseudomonas sp. Gutcm_11s]
MRKQTIANIVLSITLLATNAWWAYNTIDFGITHTYAMQACEEDSQALKQTMAILPLVASNSSSPAEVITAAMLWPDEEPFEKEGFTWIGRLGLRFDAQGKLAEVSR